MERDIDELFWDSSPQEIKEGHIYNSDTGKFICLICGSEFEKGIIYQYSGVFCEAEKAVEYHISEEHGSVFDYLINLSQQYTGLTDKQEEILQYFYQRLNDKEIVERYGGSTSTIRNYRFKFREKKKQAKIFLALMDLLSEDRNEQGDQRAESNEFITIHRGATMIDQRYEITEKEREKVLRDYLKRDGEKGRLNVFPAKEKKKIIILQYITEKFDNRQKYTELEVNNILRKIYDDYVTLRRYLIEYGFMERSRDCSEYWVKN